MMTSPLTYAHESPPPRPGPRRAPELTPARLRAYLADQLKQGQGMREVAQRTGDPYSRQLATFRIDFCLSIARELLGADL